jgi:hypothetical protein
LLYEEIRVDHSIRASVARCGKIACELDVFAKLCKGPLGYPKAPINNYGLPFQDQCLDAPYDNETEGEGGHPPVWCIPLLCSLAAGAAISIGLVCTELFGRGLLLYARGNRFLGTSFKIAGFLFLITDLAFCFMGGLRFLWRALCSLYR